MKSWCSTSARVRLPGIFRLPRMPARRRLPLRHLRRNHKIRPAKPIYGGSVLHSEKGRRDRAFCISSATNRGAIRPACRSVIWLSAFAATLFCAEVIFAQDAAVQLGPPLRVTVNRVSVSVTVSDAQGKFVHDLKRDDFRVYDNGLEQPVADFLSVQDPAQVLLLIEGG